jgi:hypothetical protein
LTYAVRFEEHASPRSCYWRTCSCWRGTISG